MPPDTRHSNRSSQDARKDQAADKSKDQQHGVGKGANEEQTRKAAKDFQNRTSQTNGNASEVLKDQIANLKNYAQSQGAFKKAPEQERKDLTQELEKYSGRQAEHLAARKDVTDRIAETARKAVEDLSSRKNPDQTLWADAKKILEDTRAAVDAMRAKDDSRVREARAGVMNALSNPGELAKQLKDDTKNAPSRQAALEKDAKQVLSQMMEAFDALRTSRKAPEKAADRAEGRVTRIQGAENDLKSRVEADRAAFDPVAHRAGVVENLKEAAAREEALRKAQGKKPDIDEAGKKLNVRESNLFYDFDHYEPQSEHKAKSNRADNIGFLMANENRSKGATEFKNVPELQKQITLADALKKGEDATRKAVSEMLGSRRFSEVKELNILWQRASDNETRSYSDSQKQFRQLLGGNHANESKAVQDAAKIVRQALEAAKVAIIPNGESFRLRLDDSTYRR